MGRVVTYVPSPVCVEQKTRNEAILVADALDIECVALCVPSSGEAPTIITGHTASIQCWPLGTKRQGQAQLVRTQELWCQPCVC